MYSILTYTMTMIIHVYRTSSACGLCYAVKIHALTQVLAYSVIVLFGT